MDGEISIEMEDNFHLAIVMGFKIKNHQLNKITCTLSANMFINII